MAIRMTIKMATEDVKYFLQRYGKCELRTRNLSTYELTQVNSWLYTIRKVSTNKGEINPGEQRVGTGWNFVSEGDNFIFRLIDPNHVEVMHTSAIKPKAGIG